MKNLRYLGYICSILMTLNYSIRFFDVMQGKVLEKEDREGENLRKNILADKKSDGKRRQIS